MVEKRKLPARGASRVEQAAKKRALTPPQASETPEPPPVPEEPPKAPLPISIQAGKPLPTVDRPQPEDLPSTEFQTVQESGVLSESIQRSRLKWISDGLFEKYWTKPVKRRGVVIEDPNNPPKDSMIKLGHVTITIEPHVFEATMFAVKDPKAPPQSEKAAKAQRPVLQYGPPGGVFVPPPPPKESPATPTAAPAADGTVREQQLGDQDDTSKAAPAVQQVQPSPAAAQPSQPGQPMRPPPAPRLPGRPETPPPAPPKSATDPVIVTLAERASEDSGLRDLMKKVAVGDAKADELRVFQQVIDEITQEHKRSISGQQGPPADRLFVDGRSVQYFAEEVRHILDIVLRANPRQKSADLRPPPGSDRLIVFLVMKALDDTKTRDQIRRIADNRAVYQDTNELKATLEALKEKVVKESRQNSAAPLASPLDTRATNGVTNGANGTPSTPTQPGMPPQSPVQSQTPSVASHAALRSKGPPPNAKPDISAIVFEFAAGNGDRYLFPKFSILEFPSPGTGSHQQHQQQQVVLASFLIVRKGSAADQPADPVLDYYQPVTIRISVPHGGGGGGGGGSHGRLLDNLAKVVARPDDVRAYMEDVMDTMTRAEYVLLAMRLPRNAEAAAAAAAASSSANASDSERPDHPSSTNAAAATNSGAQSAGHRGGLLQAPSMMHSGRGPASIGGSSGGASGGLQQPPAMGGVLWTMKPAPPPAAQAPQSGMRAPDEDERYQAMIAGVNRGPPEVV